MYKSIRLITFDAMNTLITVNRDIGTEYLKVATIYGLKDANKDDPNTIKRINDSFRTNFKKYNKEFPNYGHSSNLTSVEWWSKLVISTFCDAGFNQESERRILRNTAAHLFKLYSRGNCWKLEDGAHDILFQLRKQRPDLTLAMLSNFDERLETILRDLNIQHFFRHIFISRQLGIAKPDTGIFKHALETAGIDRPEQMLHIGDDIENDYLPVKSIGANAVIINRKSPDLSSFDKQNVDPKCIVNNLQELQSLLLN